MRSLLYVSAAFLSVAAAATVPLDIARRAQTDEIAHGNYVQAGGEYYRYHQIADGIYKGVSPEDWDDAVHVPDNRETTKPTLEELYASPVLDQRDLRSTCIEATTCVVTGTKSALFGLGNWLVTQTRALGPDVWDGLNKPFFANLAGVGLQNLAVTLLSTKELNKDGKSEPAQDCSTKMSQSDLLKALIQKVCTEKPNAVSFSANVTYADGSVQVLHLNSGVGSKIGGSDVCGAPGIVP